VISKPVHPEWICELILQTMDELKQSKHASQQTTSMDPGMEQSKLTPDFMDKA
jgi:hypothetical protein